MIREPYGVYPFDVTIDLEKDNIFSFIFNGDELESYQYSMVENSTSIGTPTRSARVDSPNIYNDYTVDIPIAGVPDTTLQGKNLLWNLTLWENNASIAGPIGIVTRNTVENAPTKIYLQDESAWLNITNYSNPVIIANITIRGERRRIKSYSTADNSIIVNAPFSFLPTSVLKDQYIIFTNYNEPGSGAQAVAKTEATIPVITSLTTNVRPPNVTAGASQVETVPIPALFQITSTRLVNEVAVTIEIDNNIKRVIDYAYYEVWYDYVNGSIVNNVQQYTETIRVFRWTNGVYTELPIPASTTVTAKKPDNSFAIVTVQGSYGTTPTAGKTFSVKRNYYDTNWYYFQSRNTPVISIPNYPTDIANNFPSRYFNFIGSYYQKQGIPIKYHMWEVYDRTKTEPVYTSDKIYNADLQFAYDNFENNKTYTINLIVVNQENAKIQLIDNTTPYPNLEVHYDPLDMKTSGEAVYNDKSYSVDVLWPDNRLAIPTQVEQPDATFSYFFDPIQEKKLNLDLTRPSEYRYDNISSQKMQFDSTDFMLSTFIAIHDPGPTPWSDEIITVRSNPAGNAIKLYKDGYTLQLRIPGSDGNDIVYPFVRARKAAEGSYNEIGDPFGLLKIVPGQQIGVETSPGVRRPLLEQEKLGFAYTWLETYEGQTQVWNNPYFWTETTSDTNIFVYKFLLYPDRAELYPLLRWVDNVDSVNGTSLKIGYNRLLTGVTNECFLMIGDETRQIISYDLDTETAIVDSPFTSAAAGMPFLCYFGNGENPLRDNMYLCEFTRQSNIPFNEITIRGNTSYYYMTLYTTSRFDASYIHNMLEYFYVPEWTAENQSTILLNLKFDGHMISSYYDGINSPIIGYRIYRNTYYADNEITPFESILIADVDADELTLINNRTTLYITDYSVRNRGIFSYTILPLTNTVIGVRIETNKVKTDWYEWIFTSIGRVKDNIYRPVEQWVFKLNIEAGVVQHNMNKVFHQGLSRFPKASIGRTNYITTSLRSLISGFDYLTTYVDDYLIFLTGGVIPRSTTDINNRKVYINETEVFDGIDLRSQEAYIFINHQQRRIDSYSFEWYGNVKSFFVTIDEPFKYFMPSTTDPDTSKYEIYGNFLPAGADDRAIVTMKKVWFDDSIERINAWNKFVANDDPVLIKDMKGNAYIGVVHNSTEQIDIRIDDFPTTMNCDITQTADAKDYLIFGI